MSRRLLNDRPVHDLLHAIVTLETSLSDRLVRGRLTTCACLGLVDRSVKNVDRLLAVDRILYICDLSAAVLGRKNFRNSLIFVIRPKMLQD